MFSVITSCLPYLVPLIPWSRGLCVLQDTGRYTYLGFAPQRVLRQDTLPTPDDPHSLWDVPPPCPALQPKEDLPPFQTGWMGFWGYEMLHGLERQGVKPYPPYAPYPFAWMGYYPAIVALDHHQKRAVAMASGFPETTPTAWERTAQKRLRVLTATYLKLLAAQTTTMPPCPALPVLTPLLSPETYTGMVQDARTSIAAGTVYQVNIAQAFSGRYAKKNLPPLYHALNQRHPAPYGGFLDMGDTVLLSLSPELFFHLSPQNDLTMRPMKGTRPRDTQDPVKDAHLKTHLQTSEKDRAENLMIVDLMRHDMAKLCHAGSVMVSELWSVESYSYVHQMTSTLRGKVYEGTDPITILKTLFPSGSVTGAPKIKAIDEITRIEPMARGPFCGSMGYISATGDMQFNVLIRTLVWGKNRLYLHTGCGIVADSDPAMEYQESLAKTGFLKPMP
ncbi:MAG: anthranilate synthase component I family protein [Alphaproteobacteria bacterium]